MVLFTGDCRAAGRLLEAMTAPHFGPYLSTLLKALTTENTEVPEKNSRTNGTRIFADLADVRGSEVRSLSEPSNAPIPLRLFFLSARIRSIRENPRSILSFLHYAMRQTEGVKKAAK